MTAPASPSIPFNPNVQYNTAPEGTHVNAPESNAPRDWPRLVAAAAALYALAVGVVSFTAWAADLRRLTDWDNNGISIQPNTALAAIASGAAILSLLLAATRLAAAFGILAGLIGLSVTFQHLTSINLGIDTLFMFDRPWGRLATRAPGRMGPPAANAFTLIGIAIVVSTLAPRFRRFVPPIGIAVTAIALLPLSGYLFRASPMFTQPNLTAIALQTATILFALGIALIASAPDHHPVRLLREDSAAGMLFRRALPFVLLLPIVVGWLCLRGQIKGLYDSTFATALLVLLLTALLVGLLWSSALAVRSREVAQARAQDALRQSEERFSRFMQSVPGLAWIKDLEGRYVYANQPAQTAFRKSADQLYGKTDAQIFPPDVAGRFVENDRRAVENPSGVQVIETLDHPDGPHHSIVSKFPIPGADGRPALVGGVAIDVTDRMRAEDALRDADRRKDEFLATLAHELRNPLAPVRNALEMLKRSNGDQESAETARAMMDRQVTHMAHLIDDLMDVSRITRGRLVLRRQRVDLAGVLRDAADACRNAYADNRLELRITFPPTPLFVQGDPVRLEQIVGNLLNNACKYTDAGGHVELRAWREDTDALIGVSDNGIGIPAAMLTRIFDMFTQAHRPDHRTGGGLGIGLSLVKGLAELHGGSISAQSDGENRGSRFILRLPAIVEEPETDRPTATPTSRRPATAIPRKILVVDDNTDSAKSLAFLLKLQGHHTQTAHDGEQALDRATAFTPDIVLLDIGLPRLSGYDVCRAIRQQRLGNQPRVVALTGWGQEEDRKKSREAGFDAHLVKPIDYDALLHLLDSFSPPIAPSPAGDRIAPSPAGDH
jgi:PAS domain S-box-containing protein